MHKFWTLSASFFNGQADPQVVTQGNVPKSVEALLPQLSPQPDNNAVHLHSMDGLTVGERVAHGKFPVGFRDLIEGELGELLLDFDL